VRFGRFDVDPLPNREGGQAFVYFTIDPFTGSEIAIKVARPTASSRRRIKEEIRVQRRLRHPNVVEMVDSDAEQAWYAMPRAECSLEELGPFERAQWMYLRAGLLGVVAAVKWAHERGYAHRDLSAGNVLVFASRWVVADWGFVYSPPRTGRPRMTLPLERFGTPEFMAPEMAVDASSARAPADVFSVGRLAAWATGLERDTLKSDNDEWTGWWRLLINRCTEWDPENRWAIRDLQSHMRALPSSATHGFPKNGGASLPGLVAPSLLKGLNAAMGARQRAAADIRSTP
jgi:eukaryotic-like serine/threonine-protein kinase